MTFPINTQRIVGTWIDKLQQRRIVQTAIDQAYSAFERSHHQWAESFFDKHFIMQTIAPWLATPQTVERTLSPYLFAAAWAAQLSTQSHRQQALLEQCLPVATAFLRLLQKSLPATPTILPILLHNHTDHEIAAELSIPTLSGIRRYV